MLKLPWILISFSVVDISFQLKLSPGCGKVSNVDPGDIRGFEFYYEDKRLGPVWRKYIIQAPPGEVSNV